MDYFFNIDLEILKFQILHPPLLDAPVLASSTQTYRGPPSQPPPIRRADLPPAAFLLGLEI
ncbi:hypothetical protein C2845_PM01G33370 [Panicum miliaceum]|uniref:Uncharacterized protein n=1 Tax=Panicum miliaceum TaxID=4540 RepID=A0A3L6TGM4_PANMI|nr:hypothetical protein C2845_PM01G33370 [Panicum miliaceum]